jgi:hypothetical protein
MERLCPLEPRSRQRSFFFSDGLVDCFQLFLNQLDFGCPRSTSERLLVGGRILDGSSGGNPSPLHQSFANFFEDD